MILLERAAFLIVRVSAILLPLIAGAGLLAGGSWTFSAFAVVFGFYFLVEAVLWSTGLGVFSSAADEFRFVAPDKDWLSGRGPLFVYSLLCLVLVPTALWIAETRAWGPFELAGAALSLGITMGSVGGLCAHEFIHGKSRLERALGTLLFGYVNYAHFKVSHLGGHHKNVGRHEDWSTSRRDESYYRFLARAITDGVRGAWQIEARRLALKGSSALHPRNFMVAYAAAQVLLHASILAALGPRALLLFWLSSAVAIVLIEMVNYLSHYGLVRRRLADGRHEPVTDAHSWESPNKVTNWFIFNAGKHAHHHRVPGARHDQLELAGAREYLPLGLPGMTLLAFVPPLYFRVMNPRLDRLIEARAES